MPASGRPARRRALIHDIPTCKELVARIMREAEAIIRRPAGYDGRLISALPSEIERAVARAQTRRGLDGLLHISRARPTASGSDSPCARPQAMAVDKGAAGAVGVARPDARRMRRARHRLRHDQHVVDRLAAAMAALEQHRLRRPARCSLRPARSASLRRGAAHAGQRLGFRQLGVTSAGERQELVLQHRDRIVRSRRVPLVDDHHRIEHDRECPRASQHIGHRARRSRRCPACRS